MAPASFGAIEPEMSRRIPFGYVWKTVYRMEGEGVAPLAVWSLRSLQKVSPCPGVLLQSKWRFPGRCLGKTSELIGDFFASYRSVFLLFGRGRVELRIYFMDLAPEIET